MRPLLTLLLAAATLPTIAAPVTDRMTLVQAIEAVRDEGYDVVFSTRLVRPWMRVRIARADDDPLTALDRALAEYGLTLDPAEGGRLLVVRAPEPGPAADPAHDTVVAAADVEDSPAPIDEITIVASRHALYSNSASDQFLTGTEIRQMPHLADDAFRALHRLPGVAASDFQAPFNLRGGTANEVKVQLNGIELFESFHMRTLFRPLSIIDPGIIGEAQVLSGGFTARHGNYLSGVVDISTARPDSAPVHEVGVSFVSAFARSRGEWLDGRAGYFLSARRGYLDLIADQLISEGEELEPRYGDLYAGFSYAVSDALELSVQALVADDDVRFVDPADGEDFGENSSLQYYWLTGDWEPVAGVHARTSVFTGRIESDESGTQSNLPEENLLRQYEQETDLAGVQTDWVVTLDADRAIEFGLRYRDLGSDYDYFLNALRRSDFVNNGLPFVVQRDIVTSADGEDATAYLSYRHRAGNGLVWEAGLRWDRQTWDEEASQVAPRLNAWYPLGERTELRAAWGEYYQPHAINELNVPDGDIAFYPAERAQHTVIGLRHTFDSRLELDLNLYDKRYDDLRPRYENLFDLYEFAPESNFDRVRIDPDDGRAWGAEATLRSPDGGRYDWWINYTWSRAEDTIDGMDVPRSWDQRHAVTANLVWHGERWRISTVARYHSGWPRTPLVVEPVLDDAGNIIGVDTDLTPRNTARFDSYTRVDFRASRFVPLARGSLEYYFEIYNVFNTENPCCTSNHVLSIGPGVSVSPEIDDYLPLFPSFGFVWRFGPGAVPAP